MISNVKYFDFFDSILASTMDAYNTATLKDLASIYKHEPDFLVEMFIQLAEQYDASSVERGLRCKIDTGETTWNDAIYEIVSDRIKNAFKFLFTDSDKFLHIIYNKYLYLEIKLITSVDRMYLQFNRTSMYEYPIDIKFNGKTSKIIDIFSGDLKEFLLPSAGCYSLNALYELINASKIENRSGIRLYNNLKKRCTRCCGFSISRYTKHYFIFVKILIKFLDILNESGIKIAESHYHESNSDFEQHLYLNIIHNGMPEIFNFKVMGSPEEKYYYFWHRQDHTQYPDMNLKEVLTTLEKFIFDRLK